MSWEGMNYIRPKGGRVDRSKFKYYNKNTGGVTGVTCSRFCIGLKVPLLPPKNFICSDAWTGGNPGPGGYRVMCVDGEEKEIVFSRNFEDDHTNNWYELHGVLEALIFASANECVPIYTDSKVALYWIMSGKPKNPDIMHYDEIVVTLSRIRDLLKTKKYDLAHWSTKRWGEIPADYGRK